MNMKMKIKSLFIIMLATIIMLSACKAADITTSDTASNTESTAESIENDENIDSAESTTNVPVTTTVNASFFDTMDIYDKLAADSREIQQFIVLLNKIRGSYNVNKFMINEDNILCLGIDASYSTIYELDKAMKDLSEILNVSSFNWKNVEVNFKGMQVTFEEGRWESWLQNMNGEPEAARTKLQEFALITITDMDISALSFNLIDIGSITPSEGLKYIEETMDIAALNQGGKVVTDVTYACLKSNNNIYYSDVAYYYNVFQYTNDNKDKTASETVLLYELAISPDGQSAADLNYKNGRYYIATTKGDVRSAVLNEGILLDKYVIDKNYSLIMTMEDYKYEKILKVECFENGALDKPIQMIAHVKNTNGKWMIQEVIPADQTEKIAAISSEHTLRQTNESQTTVYSYAELSGMKKNMITEIDAAIENNKLFQIELLDLSKRGSIYYDFNEDGNLERISFEFIQHKNPEGYPSNQELEICYGTSALYWLFIDIPLDYDTNMCITNIGVCDVDKSDGHLNLIVTEAPRGRIYGESTLYSLKHGGIEKLVALNEEILGVSGDGKLYYWGGNLQESYYLYFNPDYVIRYFDTKLMEYVGTDQIIGKTLSGFDHSIIFDTQDRVPTGPPVEVTMDFPGAIRQVKEGEKVTILSFGGDTAKIQCEDGLVGWIGGFHMVWD